MVVVVVVVPLVAAAIHLAPTLVTAAPTTAHTNGSPTSQTRLSSDVSLALTNGVLSVGGHPTASTQSALVLVPFNAKLWPPAVSNSLALPVVQMGGLDVVTLVAAMADVVVVVVVVVEIQLPRLRQLLLKRPLTILLLLLPPIQLPPATQHPSRSYLMAAPRTLPWNIVGMRTKMALHLTLKLTLPFPITHPLVT